MSGAERGQDTRRLLLEVLRPPSASDWALPLACRSARRGTAVGFAMAGYRNRRENGIEVRCHLGARPGIEDVVVPRVGEDDNADRISCRGLAENRSLNHGERPIRRRPRRRSAGNARTSALSWNPRGAFSTESSSSACPPPMRLPNVSRNLPVSAWQKTRSRSRATKVQVVGEAAAWWPDRLGSSRGVGRA